MQGNHWWVQVIGTDPDYQRKGFGGRMLDFIGAVADKNSMPTYLDTSGQANENFYKKHDFRVVGKYVLTAGSDTMDTDGGIAAMMRDSK